MSRRCGPTAPCRASRGTGRGRRSETAPFSEHLERDGARARVCLSRFVLRTSVVRALPSNLHRPRVPPERWRHRSTARTAVGHKTGAVRLHVWSGISRGNLGCARNQARGPVRHADARHWKQRTHRLRSRGLFPQHRPRGLRDRRQHAPAVLRRGRGHHLVPEGAPGAVPRLQARRGGHPQPHHGPGPGGRIRPGGRSSIAAQPSHDMAAKMPSRTSTRTPSARSTYWRPTRQPPPRSALFLHEHEQGLRRCAERVPLQGARDALGVRRRRTPTASTRLASDRPSLHSLFGASKVAGGRHGAGVRPLLRHEGRLSSAAGA